MKLRRDQNTQKLLSEHSQRKNKGFILKDDYIYIHFYFGPVVFWLTPPMFPLTENQFLIHNGGASALISRERRLVSAGSFYFLPLIKVQQHSRFYCIINGGGRQRRRSGNSRYCQKMSSHLLITAAERLELLLQCLLVALLASSHQFQRNIRKILHLYNREVSEKL